MTQEKLRRVVARRGADRGFPGKRSPKLYRQQARAATDRSIIVRRDAFDESRFDVVVEPPIDGTFHDLEFDDVKVARGYASGLRLVLALPVVDEVAP